MESTSSEKSKKVILGFLEDTADEDSHYSSWEEITSEINREKVNFNKEENKELAEKILNLVIEWFDGYHDEWIEDDIAFGDDQINVSLALQNQGYVPNETIRKSLLPLFALSIIRYDHFEDSDNPTFKKNAKQLFEGYLGKCSLKEESALVEGILKALEDQFIYGREFDSDLCSYICSILKERDVSDETIKVSLFPAFAKEIASNGVQYYSEESFKNWAKNINFNKNEATAKEILTFIEGQRENGKGIEQYSNIVAETLKECGVSVVRYEYIIQLKENFEKGDYSYRVKDTVAELIAKIDKDDLSPEEVLSIVNELKLDNLFKLATAAKKPVKTNAQFILDFKQLYLSPHLQQ